MKDEPSVASKISSGPPKFMVGVAARLDALEPADLGLMREARIHWLRCSEFGFDAAAFLRGEAQDGKFERVKDQVAMRKAEGFDFLGITPGPRDLDGMGLVPGSAAYIDSYQKICAFFAKQFLGLIDWWQVANELDIWIFRDKLSLEESAEFLKAGIRGVKEVSSDLQTGINITLFPSLPGLVDGNTDRHEGVFLAASIYGDEEMRPLVDYAGFDSYPGSWREGGAESWSGYLDEFYALVRKPVLIMEFGYASAGSLMSEAEVAAGAYPCEVKKWKFAWQDGHTKENQADYLEAALRIFAEKSFVLGASYFSWKDAKSCWQCHQNDCPAETAWGLLDREGRKKPSYDRLQSTVADLFLEEKGA